MIPETVQWFLITAGLIAIGGLIYIVGRQWRLLSRYRRAQQHTRDLQKQRRENMIESIRILAMTLEQEQVEPSEGCIRIKGLLDHVAPELLTEKPYDVFQTMYEKTEHMPTHEARRQADPKLIRRLDEERFALESRHADHIREAAMAIRFHSFEETTALANTGSVNTINPARSTMSH